MALKLNIQPEIEEEMENLIPKVKVRSKTEYINQAIRQYNNHLKRQLELTKLKDYFQSYRKEAKEILDEFAKIRSPVD